MRAHRPLRARHPFARTGLLLLAALAVPAVLTVLAQVLDAPPVPSWLTTLALLSLLFASTAMVLVFFFRTQEWDGVGGALTFHAFVHLLVFGWLLGNRFLPLMNTEWRNASQWVLILMILPAVVWVVVEFARLPPHSRIVKEPKL